MEKLLENNNVHIMGEIATDFVFSHQTFGEGFYTAQVKILRSSREVDLIPLMVSDRMIDLTQGSFIGTLVEVTGQYRSLNKVHNGKTRLSLYIFALDIGPGTAKSRTELNNHIALKGFICKPTTYRKTPLGREIADMLLAVNRPYGKSDYIPCIAWGKTARWASNLTVGTKLEIFGRIQSREYIKKLAEEQSEKRVAYEVSCSKIILPQE